MYKGVKLFVGLILAGTVVKSVNAQQVAPFKTGDRVAFLGNSITDGGHYHSYIWLYYMTRLPNQRITILNAGIGGDDVVQMGNRLEEDVLSKKPSVIAFTWGMNDTGYFEWYKPDAKAIAEKKLERSFAAFNVAADKLQKLIGIRKILMLGSPYDDKVKIKGNLYPGKADAFKKVIAFQQQAVKQRGWGLVDFYHPMTEINRKGQQTDSLYSLTPTDRIHPDNDGHMVMAYLFLKAQGFANKPVADVVINASKRRVEKSVNATVTNVLVKGNDISFDYLAGSLPYPLDTIARGWGQQSPQSKALKVVPFMDEFNREVITVKGLTAGTYKLLIDNQQIGEWSGEQIAAGVNLAEQMYTPQYQQAIQIRELNEERWEIEKRFRVYAFMQFDLLKEKGKLFADDKAAMDTVIKYAKTQPFINGNKDSYTKSQFKSVRNAWQKQMDVLTDAIYTINKPLVRKIVLVKIR
ncbi:hypothetical protein DJ568_08370 [Mucilaginibacter hurinus]|uniref:SGNH hydrolase-type esterase domain-containing protein n=1 Tax=Mucilaginibacter hurinus TaxID=2201324 RepID=A0A367GNX6_9SPHI|nr:SGNH/GDSL hydrolase family protein [Mucilaginibacter hurinus]RCH55192.1 hypothetical protein DJ568_08370 [Mucilaginibacter hurinus]